MGSLQFISVVTGANRGLGLETARRLSKAGHHVVITARNEAQGVAAEHQLTKEGGNVSFLLLDMADIDSIQSFVKTLDRQFGRIDVLVNNAGIFIDRDHDAPIARQATEISKTFTTNTLGPYVLSRLVIPGMLERSYGRIVNVSSGMGQLAEMNSGFPAYRLSKTALNAVTRMMADETKGTNVLINSVCPGWVKTEMGGANATRSIAEGTNGIVWAATLPEGGPSGGFFRDGVAMAF